MLSGSCATAQSWGGATWSNALTRFAPPPPPSLEGVVRWCGERVKAFNAFPIFPEHALIVGATYGRSQ